MKNFPKYLQEKNYFISRKYLNFLKMRAYAFLFQAFPKKLHSRTFAQFTSKKKERKELMKYEENVFFLIPSVYAALKCFYSTLLFCSIN